MKLYSSSILCVGFIVFFSCKVPDKPIRSDFCDLLRPEVEKLKSMTEAEVKALTRPRREAIRNLRKTFKKRCV